MRPFTANQVSRMQAVRAAGVMAAAQVQSSGGTAWTVVRPVGDGIGSAIVATSIGTIQATVVSPQSAVPATFAAPAFLGRDSWQLYALTADLAGIVLAVDDEITSVDDPELVFRISTVDTNDDGAELYTTCDLEETA